MGLEGGDRRGQLVVLRGQGVELGGHLRGLATVRLALLAQVLDLGLGPGQADAQQPTEHAERDGEGQ